MSLRFLTAGESHGKGLVGILEGLPSGLRISTEALQAEMRRRKLGFGRGARQKIEDDQVEILSGLRHGKTLGSPVGLLIWNRDWQAWSEVMAAEGEPTAAAVRKKVSIPRPGHADLIGGIKYRHSDMRNVLERSSARETTMRVALASFARFFLSELGVEIGSRVIQIGRSRDASEFRGRVGQMNAEADSSPVRCLSSAVSKKMVAEITSASKAGDTVGGIFEVWVSGLPVGLGSYSQWDRRLEAGLGEAFLSLNAIKGVELGLGFALGSLPGSRAHDSPLSAQGKLQFSSNRSGGIDGGMSTGQALVVRAVMKPLSTLMKALPSVDLRTGKGARAHIERSDCCAVPSAAVIGESLAALVICEAVLEKFGGDSMEEIKPRVEKWRKLSPIKT